MCNHDDQNHYFHTKSEKYVKILKRRAKFIIKKYAMKYRAVKKVVGGLQP